MTYAKILRPAAGLECFVCRAPVDVEADTVIEVAPLGRGFKVAVGICPICAERAREADGSIQPLADSIREVYAGGVVTVEKCTRPPLELERKAVSNAGRKHPPFGAALAENPPPADELLCVLLGSDHAKAIPDPKLIVRPEDNPARLRFDVAEGREVRVVHPHDADPKRLVRLAQALIDYGAQSVELVVHPVRPGAAGTEILRIVPRLAP